MLNRTRRLFTVSALTVLAMVLLAAAPAKAQSITILNLSPCIQWIQVSNSNGVQCIGTALVANAQKTVEANGSGIRKIQAGPTKSVDYCCFAKKVDARVDLSGNNWRIEIYGDHLRVVDNHTWTEVFSVNAALNGCLKSSVAVGVGGPGSSGEPETPRN